MAAPGERPLKDFTLRPIVKPEEMRSVEEVQRVAWGLVDEPPVPVPIQRAIQDNGGLLLGAFADIHLAGFALGFLGWDGTTLYHYSHMTAVRPEYQNHRLGFRLKAYQRDEVLRQGLGLIRWTFDPLQSKNAFLNVHRLGVRVDGYLVHYYGRMGSQVNRDVESDRLRVAWEIGTPRVEERLARPPARPDDDARRVAAAQPVLESTVGETGLRVPTAVAEPTAPTAQLEIPFDVGLVREHAPGTLRTWRHATRDAFQASLDAGYEVDDFVIVSREHERRSFYLLAKAPPAPSA